MPRIVIGVTGSFGTGKTTVARLFRSKGAKVMDADVIAHSALKKGTPTYKRVVAAFGRSILKANGEIDRRQLAGVVFANKKHLNRLCRIVHPFVIDEIKRRTRDEGRGTKHEIFVIDAPLLIEAGVDKLVDLLVVVAASRKNQMARCSAMFGLGEREVLKRIRIQMPLERKMSMADFIIDNDGARSQTKKQVDDIWRRIWR